MRNNRTGIVGVVMMSVVGCGGGSGGANIGTIDGEQDFHAFMEAIALPLAGVLAELADSMTMPLTEDPDTLAAANPAPCPGGGMVDLDPATSLGTFTDCKMGSIGVSGSLRLSFTGTGPVVYGVNLGTGILTLSGGAMGMVQFLNGMIQWQNNPPTDDTFWLGRARVGGMDVCAWGGAGACPAF